MKIFIGFSEVAGFYSILSQGFVDSGHTVHFRSFGPNPFSYSIESHPSKTQRFLWFSNMLYQKSPNIFLKIPAYLFHLFVRVIAVFPLMLKSDLIILNYSGTLLFYLDILVLRLLGKRIIYIFHGSDARAPYFNGKYIYPSFSLDRLRRLTYVASLRIRIIQGLGCICMAPPAISHFFSKPILNLSIIGLPWPQPVKDTLRNSTDNLLAKSFTILHAPSNNINKGTSQIRAAIRQLSDSTTNIKYVEISGQSNSAVLEAISKADLVIDELWSDARLAGLGCEAATCQVPTLIGTNYTDQEWSEDTNNTFPLVFTTPPEKLVESISNLISSPLELSNLKNQLASAYHMYQPEEYATRMLNIFFSSPYQLNYETFWYDPLKCRYLFGWGAPRETVISVIVDYVNKYGLKSLCLPQGSRTLDQIKCIMSSKSNHT